MVIEFRPAKEEDLDMLFSWVNDEAVRENSFNNNKVQYSDHKAWFQKKMKSSDTRIYICFEEGKAIGQIRIDIEGCTGIIDYSVAREFRGRGYGTEMLNYIVTTTKGDTSIYKLIGRVKYGNLASQTAFRKAGFQREDLKEYIEYSFFLSELSK